MFLVFGASIASEKSCGGMMLRGLTQTASRILLASPEKTSTSSCYLYQAPVPDSLRSGSTPAGCMPLTLMESSPYSGFATATCARCAGFVRLASQFLDFSRTLAPYHQEQVATTAYTETSKSLVFVGGQSGTFPARLRLQLCCFAFCVCVFCVLLFGSVLFGFLFSRRALRPAPRSRS